MTPTSAYSVRQLRWIPVLTTHGPETVTLDEAYTRSHEIRGFDVRDPIVRAALNRFYVTTGVLIARAAGVTKDNAAAFARSGFTAEQVSSALDPIDDHLWLIHEATPFLQCAGLAEICADRPGDPAAELLPRTPGGSGKVWFDVPGDIFNESSLTPEAAALALVAHWFYSPKSNKRQSSTVTVMNDGEETEKTAKWFHLGSLGMAGLNTGRSLTFWHRGDTLAHFLLLNVARYWVEETSLPSWATSRSLVITGESLAGSTFTANAALLRHDELTGTFTETIRAGFPLGTDTDRVKELTNEQLRVSSFEDPTRVWHDVLVQKKTVPVLFSGFSLHHSTAQNMRHWFIEAGRPHVKHGILISRTGDLEVLALEAAVTTGNPTVTTAGWMTFNGAHLEPDIAARELVTELAETAVRRPELALSKAFDIAFPKSGEGRNAKSPPQFHAAYARAVRSFHTTLEPLFGHAVSQMVAGETPDTIVDDVRRATVDAFDHAAQPYLSTRTLPAIARARGTITGSFTVTAPDQSDHISAQVSQFIRRRSTDTAYRVAIARGLHAGTESQVGRHLNFTGVDISEVTPVTRAFGALAATPHLAHQPGAKFGHALARLTDRLGESFDAPGGINSRVAMLPSLDLDGAVVAIFGLLTRLSANSVNVSFHDVVDLIRAWDTGSDHDKSIHRMNLLYTYHSTPQKAA